MNETTARSAESRVAAILLAAGESRRMGARNKLLLDIDGEPMIRRATRTLVGGGFIEVVVVLGFEAERVRAALDGLAVRPIVHHHFADGQMSSVRAGLDALTPGYEGVLIGLSDQPWLTVDDVRTVHRAFLTRQRGQILVPVHAGQRGNPIVLDSRSARQIVEAGVNFGCKHLIAKHPDLVCTYDMDTDHVLRDIDRPDEYAALTASGS